MKHLWSLIVTILLLGLLVNLTWFLAESRFETVEPVPEFTQFNAGSERKEAFFDYFVPLIRQENERILALRATVLSFHAERENLSYKEQEQLHEIAERYELDNFSITDDNHWNTLIRRVDLIPVSLAVAQAANESAWGTSRFARQGFNYFGHWCFKKGCGLTPKRREEGMNHEVARFDSPRESVRKYMLNLNRHYAYLELRQKRALMRQQNQSISGLALLPTLEKYSERGTHYLNELGSMIRFNNLARLDRKTNIQTDTL